MSLNWDMKNVKDWEELTDHEKKVAEVLIWMTMPVGIPTITEKTAKEFQARLQLIELLFGGMTVEDDGSPRLIKLEEVERFIGLHTNASTLTRTQFNKNQLSRFYKAKGL